MVGVVSACVAGVVFIALISSLRAAAGAGRAEGEVVVVVVPPGADAS